MMCLTPGTPDTRGVPAAELQSFVRSVSSREVHLADDPSAAWHLARRWAGPDDLIAITGSFFLIAELRDLVLSDVALSLAVPFTERHGV